MLLNKLLLILPIGLTWCIRFDFYKSFNPALIQRRIDEVASSKTNQANQQLSDFKNTDGFEKSSHKNTSEKGKDDKEYEKHSYGSDGGHKGEQHSDKADEYAHNAQAASQKGAKFSQKKGHKKGHKTKGWHNTFLRDEYHKEHKFYNDEHKSGAYEKHGAQHEKYHKNAKATKNGSRQENQYVQKKKGMKGHHNSERNEEKVKGYKHKQGDEYKHGIEEKYRQKNSGKGGTHYAFKGH